MKSLLFCLIISLTACTVPVKQDFPKVPESFLQQPKELKTVPDNSSFSDMIEVMLDNYSSYYDVSERLKSWQEWYKQQKSIYEKVK